MTAQSPPPLHVLRGILRLLRTPKLPKELAKKAPIQQGHLNSTRPFVLERYRASQHEKSPETIERLRKVAYDYYMLQEALQERGRLYQLDTGAEVVLSPKEMSRRAAARAGLQLPKLNPDLDSKGPNA